MNSLSFVSVFQMGTVAVPGSEVAYNMIEPVAIVTPNLDLNIFMPEGEVRRRP